MLMSLKLEPSSYFKFAHIIGILFLHFAIYQSLPLSIYVHVCPPPSPGPLLRKLQCPLEFPSPLFSGQISAWESLIHYLTADPGGGGTLDLKLGRHVRRAQKITGPLLVQNSREILCKPTLISANFSSN